MDESKAGNVAGRVTIEGTVPANPPIKLEADPYCAKQNPNGARFENFVVDDGGLENVFVYVKDGLGDYGFDVPAEPVKLDQQGCQYRPHVVGIRVGQKLVILNSDDTLHNVHAMGKANGEWNKGQALKNMSRPAGVQVARGDAAVQVRRPQLDAGLRGRARASVFLSHPRRRNSSS